MGVERENWYMGIFVEVEMKEFQRIAGGRLPGCNGEKHSNAPLPLLKLDLLGKWKLGIREAKTRGPCICREAPWLALGRHTVSSEKVV